MKHYFVDPVNGDDNNSGTLESPWKTMPVELEDHTAYCGLPLPKRIEFDTTIMDPKLYKTITAPLNPRWCFSEYKEEPKKKLWQRIKERFYDWLWKYWRR